MTRILIVRHGESQSNRLHCIAGFLDLDLTEVGYRQAEETAAHLANEKIDAVYSSSLQRAMHTAQPHARRRGLSVTPCDELREMYCGEWEGKTIVDLAREYPVTYAENFVKHYGISRADGGESAMECGERVYRKVLEIAKAHPDETVLLVSHGGAIRSFWAIISGIPAEQVDDSTLPWATNASYSTVLFDGERLIPQEYSNDSHMTTVTKVHV
ncbi:MAG: histidine phosphatase family protein [Clostridia bacterium]|nr:histidine phosphatase family protein [Clostridia bacterium]